MISNIKNQLKKNYIDRVFFKNLLLPSYNRIYQYLIKDKGMTSIEADNIIEDIIKFTELLSNIPNYTRMSKTRQYVNGFFKFINSKLKKFRGIRSYRF